MIQTVRVYVEDPLQADWEEIAEKLVHAINNSSVSTKKVNPFCLVYLWDAHSTLKAMTEPIRRTPAVETGRWTHRILSFGATSLTDNEKQHSG